MLFLQLQVAAGGLSELVGRRRDVQHVVGDLEREPDRLAVPRRAPSSASARRTGRRAADRRRGGDQRARLRAMDPLELVERERASLALEIEQLTADHAAGAGRDA